MGPKHFLGGSIQDLHLIIILHHCQEVIDRAPLSGGDGAWGVHHVLFPWTSGLIPGAQRAILANRKQPVPVFEPVQPRYLAHMAVELAGPVVRIPRIGQEDAAIDAAGGHHMAAGRPVERSGPGDRFGSQGLGTFIGMRVQQVNRRPVHRQHQAQPGRMPRQGGAIGSKWHLVGFCDVAGHADHQPLRSPQKDRYRVSVWLKIDGQDRTFALAGTEQFPCGLPHRDGTIGAA